VVGFTNLYLAGEPKYLKKIKLEKNQENLKKIEDINNSFHVMCD
jgi:hypothetical protein